jgi:hypothetical protein
MREVKRSMALAAAHGVLGSFSHDFIAMFRIDCPCPQRIFKTLSTFDVGVEKFEDIGLPLLDAQIHEIVAIIRGLTDSGVDLQEIGLLHTVEFGSEGTAGSRIVIVGGVDKHDRRGRFTDHCQQPFPEFGRALPGIRASAECDFGADGSIALGDEQGKHSAERMPHDGDALGVDSGCCF